MNEITREKTIAKRWSMFRKGGVIAKIWADHYYIAVRIPFIRHPGHQPQNEPYNGEAGVHTAISFVHAGLGPGYEEYTTLFPTHVNVLGKSLLTSIQNMELSEPESTFRKLPSSMSICVATVPPITIFLQAFRLQNSGCMVMMGPYIIVAGPRWKRSPYATSSTLS